MFIPEQLTTSQSRRRKQAKVDHGECEWEGECIKVELIFDRSLIGAGIASKTKLGKQRPLGWGGGGSYLVTLKLSDSKMLMINELINSCKFPLR